MWSTGLGGCRCPRPAGLARPSRPSATAAITVHVAGNARRCFTASSPEEVSTRTGNGLKRALWRFAHTPAAEEQGQGTGRLAGHCLLCGAALSVCWSRARRPDGVGPPAFLGRFLPKLGGAASRCRPSFLPPPGGAWRALVPAPRRAVNHTVPDDRGRLGGAATVDAGRAGEGGPRRRGLRWLAPRARTPAAPMRPDRCGLVEAMPLRGRWRSPLACRLARRIVPVSGGRRSRPQEPR